MHAWRNITSNNMLMGSTYIYIFFNYSRKGKLFLKAITEMRSCLFLLENWSPYWKRKTEEN